MLVSCGKDHHRQSPLAVSDFRLHAIEQRVGRLDADEVDREMLAVDAEAYDRPAAAPFREAVAKFYLATHPPCADWSGRRSEEERNFIHDSRFMLDDFEALVGRLELTPLRHDLDLAWQRAALGSRKGSARHDCATNPETQGEVMRNSKAQMRDALDRMEAAMNAAD